MEKEERESVREKFHLHSTSNQVEEEQYLPELRVYCWYKIIIPEQNTEDAYEESNKRKKTIRMEYTDPFFTCKQIKHLKPSLVKMVPGQF